LSDRLFLERIIRGLIANNINVGVASFGKKNVIINTMNTLLYGSRTEWGSDPYFNSSNVITVPDLREAWKNSLKRISSTFKDYVKKADGDVDKAFENFLREKKPEREAKYFCLKLDPAAKVQMIGMICNYYNSKDPQLNISLQDVRFFDDDGDNIRAALATGIMAHQVTKSGLTEDWWKQECKSIDACGAYEPFFQQEPEQQIQQQGEDEEDSSSTEYSWGMSSPDNLERSILDE
jgi:hypothetical protein